jgi:hypothetical protein
MYICEYICVYIYTYVPTYVCTYIHMYVYIHICAEARFFQNVFVPRGDLLNIKIKYEKYEELSRSVD